MDSQYGIKYNPHVYITQALSALAGLYPAYLYIQEIIGSSPFQKRDPDSLTVLRIFHKYLLLLRDGCHRPFLFNKQKLEEDIIFLDHLVKPYGHHTESKVKEDCRLLVPRELDKNTPLDAVLNPLLQWRDNKKYLHSQLFGVALTLHLMHRLISLDHRFLMCNWCGLINIINSDFPDEHNFMNAVDNWVHQTRVHPIIVLPANPSHPSLTPSINIDRKFGLIIFNSDSQKMILKKINEDIEKCF